LKFAYLTEVAALMAAHHLLFIEQSGELPNQTIGDYYIRSRNRFNRWMRDLSDLEKGVAVSDPFRMLGLVAPRPAIRSLAEQIMINEMIARIWTVLLIARDRHNGIDRVRPVAHNVFLGHLSVRHKAVSACLNDQGMSQKDIVEVERIRNATERWTDILCCPVMNFYDLWQYAFDQDRAKQFLADRADQKSMSHQSQVWVLILAGMRHSFPDTDGLAAPIHDDDRAITRLILSSFPEQAPEMAFWMSSRLRQARHC
jgi:hypothetical protein